MLLLFINLRMLHVGVVRCRNANILLVRHWLRYIGDNGKL